VEIGIARPPCHDRFLFRVTKNEGDFHKGDYVVLQYDWAPSPCKLPEEMYSGTSVWEFTLDADESNKGTLREMMGLLDTRRVNDQPERLRGRWKASPFGALKMCGDNRAEDLPLDAQVREFKFGSNDYKRVSSR